MYGSAREISLGVAEMLRPPQRITVADAAARDLNIVNPSGSIGTWSPDVAPYMVEPMNMTRSRLYEAVVFAGPARSGKTVALVDGNITYSITCDPADTLVVQTSQSQAEDFSKTRIDRAIKASPALAARLSPRAHDDNVLLKFFRSGMALRIGWPSIGQLSGKDIRRVLMTDVDNFTGDLSIDEAFGYALKRTQTYMSAGMLVAESSPARDYTKQGWRPSTPHEAPPADGILALYNRGDRRRFFWPCVECKARFEAKPGLDLFRLPPFEELVETMRAADPLELSERWSLVFCPHCGVGIEHRWKRAMNLAGVWAPEGTMVNQDGSLSGTPLRSRIASFYLGGVAAAYQPWSSLVERYLQAVKHYAVTGESRPLKSTMNVDQAVPFVPISNKAARDSHFLRSRAEAWLEQHVPGGCRFLTAAVDIQKHRFVVQVRGWGERGEKWIVDRYALKSSARDDGRGGKLPLDPAGYLEDWGRLIEKVIERRYPLSDGSGRSMPIMFVAIDSGGRAGVTERAYDFWRLLRSRNLHRRVRLVKGASSDSAPRVEEKYPDTRKRRDRKAGAAGDVPVVMLNTTILKDSIVADLQRTVPGPGYFHFPEWLPTSFYEELTAEVRGAKRWENPSGARNEAFDLEVYNLAAGLLLKVESIDWNAPPRWAESWDRNSEVNTTEAPVVALRPRRGIRSSGASVY